MHRSVQFLANLRWCVLAVVLTAAAPLSAQDVKDAPPLAKGEIKDGIRVLQVQSNITKTVGMSRAPGEKEDPIIAKVHNENPKVCKVQSIIDDPRHVLVTGVAPGISRVTFTSKEGRDEIIDVRVVSDDDNLREQQRKDFLEQVRKAVPASNIEVIVAPNNTIIISGYLLTPQDTQIIMGMARALWGAQANVIDTMRVGHVPQIQIECTMAVVNRSKLRSAAFNFVINRQNYFVSSLFAAQSYSNSIITATQAAAASASSSPSNLTFGVVGPNGAFSGYLQALRTEGLAKIHSEPKVVTLSGKPAQFVSGGETPILTSSGVGSPTVTYKDFGTTLTVLPIVLGDGKIHLDISPTLSSRNDANGIVLPGGGGTVVPGFDKRGVQVSVQLMDGETIAIGGMIQFNVNSSVIKVPILGDLPFLGAAFSSKTSDEREEELIILVTPRLVDPMACNQVPGRLPTQLTRTPDDFELFLEQLLELPRGPRQICTDGHYTAAHKNGPTAGMYPCNDSSPGRFGHRGAAGCATGTCATGTCATGCGSNGTVSSGVPVAGPVPAAPIARINDTPRMPVSPIAPVSLPSAPPLQMEQPVAAPALRLPGPGAVTDLPAPKE